jgi:sugar lactone lactonase YvrE
VAPEDVAVDGNGCVIAGGDDGTIWRWPPDARPGATAEPLTNTGGRPLGIEVDPRDGSLVVCDAYRGLLRVSPRGSVVELTKSAAGTPILFCNNASIARDGTVFFTDSSSRFPLHAWKKEMLEYQPNGRLLRYEPATGDTSVVTQGLYFPNGVALTPDETAVMVVETSAHRLLRIPVETGVSEVIADLPAYPDNMSAVGDGTYWIALPSPRVAALERLLPHPGVRRVVNLLPEFVQPKPARYSLVVLMTQDGTVRRTVHGPAGRYCMVTGVRQHGETLWLGSLTEPGIARLDL